MIWQFGNTQAWIGNTMRWYLRTTLLLFLYFFFFFNSSDVRAAVTTFLDGG